MTKATDVHSLWIHLRRRRQPRQRSRALRHHHLPVRTASDVTQVTDAAGNITQYTYSPGRTGKLLTQVKDALGHTTTFGYDDLGRLA